MEPFESHSKNNSTIDQLLDSSLREFGAAEPRPGLEMRLLAALEAEQKRAAATAPWWRNWQLASGIVAVLMLAAWGVASWLHPSRQVAHTNGGARAPQGQSPVVPAKTSDLQLACACPLKLRPHKQVELRDAAASLRKASERHPRLEEFPSPQPLSEQEQLLVRFVTQHRSEAILLARAQAANDAEWQPYRQAFPPSTPQ